MRVFDETDLNQEQRAQLDDRLTDYTTRLPQQVVMAYRHLSVLGPDGEGGTRTDTVDLGPARVTDTITGRVIDHLTATDRLLSTSLAPAALLTDRFGIVGPDNDAVEADKLLGYFYRLPRLPKLAGPDVLRDCLARGAADGLFGLASGAAWYAPDAVRRFATPIDPAGALEALDRFTDLYQTGDLPEFYKIVNTLLAHMPQILAWHAAERPSNGRIEGTNNLLQVLHRTAHGFTNPANFAARGLLVA